MMTSKDRKSSKSTEREAAGDVKQKVNAVLDEIITAVSKGSQLDSYFESRIADIRALDENAFSHISRRFIKADPREKEIIVKCLKFWPGIEHLKFLQEFLSREPFWPRIGTSMLDLFNKRDAMVDSGLMSSILELDSLTQRLKHHVLQRDPLHEKPAASTIEEFLKRPDKEKEGIIIQLIDEAGPEVTPLLLLIFEKDAQWSMKAAEFISTLATVNALCILKGIYEETQKKDILKIIKKLIHTLRQKGIAVEDYETAQPAEAVFKKITLPDPRAFISSIDGVGDRIIFMLKPLTTHESRLFEIFMNDSAGIKEIASVPLSRKDAERFINRISGDEKIDFYETTAQNACFLVEEVHTYNQETGAVVSGSIAQWRSMFSDILNTQAQPIIYDCIDADKIRSQSSLLKIVEKIYKRVEIIVWFIDSAEAKEGWIRYKQAKNSPLVLSPYQMEERLQDQYRDTATAFFNQTRRARFKRRLEEMAYLFYRQNCAEEAHSAFAAALSLAPDGTSPDKNTFCLSLVKEGFKFYESNTVIKGTPDKKIIDPKDVSLLA
ncbi:MAG: hypothetical protein NTZ51_11845 [Proteobacteria bacterium]|nr:hypothetical protein [Pseudomonadota bacterium]